MMGAAEPRSHGAFRERRVVPAPFFTLADLHRLPIPARPWHVEGLIPGRTVTMLGGDGGVGKSLLALQLAVEVVFEQGRGVQERPPGRLLFFRQPCHGVHGRATS